MEERALPYESASELREAHASLLEELDAALAGDMKGAAEAAALRRLEPRIRRFLERGAASGAYIEEVTQRTSCQVLLDYWKSSLAAAGLRPPVARLAKFDADQLPDLLDKACPYVGLDAFRDATYFFGRDADTRALVEQLRDAPLLVVLGSSGSGKSSLVMGGVLPTLREAAPAPLVIVPPFVPGKAVLEALAAAVSRRTTASPDELRREADLLRSDPLRLAELVGGTAAPATLVVVDQFEEVFTLCSATEREAFARLLAGLLQASRGHRVLLTVREEFRSRIVELLPLGPYLEQAWYSMRPMGYEELRAAVERPAAAVNLQFQSGVVDDLVKKVLGQPAALPLLQFTLRALWEARDRNRITFEVYRRIGTPLQALSDSADRFLDALVPQTREEVQRILLELVRVDELLEAYRQPVQRSQLLQAGKAETASVLDLLSRNDYVRITPVRNGGDAIVEIKHEALVRNWPRFVAWIDEKRHERRRRLALTDVAVQWARDGRPSERLLTGWPLREAEGLVDLTPVEKEFVAASGEAARRRDQDQVRAKTRRFKIYLAIAIFVGAVCAFAVVAMYRKNAAIEQASKAREDAHQSQERLLGAMRLQPLNFVDTHLDLALLLGLEALRMEPREAEIQGSLLSALMANLELDEILPGEPGQSQRIRAVAYSPNGKVLASASEDGTILLRDANAGHMRHHLLVGHDRPVFGVAFTPDGKLLASAGEDGTVRLWNVETGHVDGILQQGAPAYGVAISPDGGTLACACGDGTVRLWSLDSGKLLAGLSHDSEARDGPRQPVYQVAFSPNGRLLASGGMDGRVVFWDVKARRRAGQPLKPYRQVFAMAFSHNGKILATGNLEGRTDLWDVRRRKWIDALTKQIRGVYGIAFSPDDSFLATASSDRTIYVQQLRPDGRPKSEPRRLMGYAEEFYSVTFADRDRLATGTGQGTVVLWSLAGRYRFGTMLRKASNTPAYVAFSHDTLVSSSQDTVRFWNPAKAKPPMDVPAGQTGITALVAAPGGNSVITIGRDGSAKVWDGAARSSVATIKKASVAALSSDGTTLAVGVEREGNPEIQLFDLPGAKNRGRSFGIRGDEIVALALSVDGSRLAAATCMARRFRCDITGIQVWNAGTGTPMGSWDPGAPVNALAFSPKGNLLALGGHDGIVRVMDLDRGSELMALASHRGDVMALAFDSEGKLLASGGLDQTLLLWDVASGQVMLQLPHSAAVLSVAFSPDGKLLGTGGTDGTIDTWEVRSIESLVAAACRVAGRNLEKDELRRYFGGGYARITCREVIVNDADADALAGKRAHAEELFALAARANPDMPDAVADNLACWMGSVDGFAATVRPACERAVALASESEKGLYMDSRGLARALTGDVTGAVDDFTAAVHYFESSPAEGGMRPEYIERRRRWIAALKEGRNPFEPGELASLRLEEE
jgi:WD40 repeat protein